MIDRIALLKQAAFRNKQTECCRICKGNVIESKPYCIRHFRMLDGGGYLANLVCDVAKGRRYDEADALIMVRDKFPKFRYGKDKNRLDISPHLSLVRFINGWVVTVQDSQQQHEVGRYPTMIKALRAVLDNRASFSLHNRWAAKALIR